MAKKIRIYWTEPARKDLQDIYDYLAEVSVVIAERIIHRIIAKAATLQKGFSEIGQVEPLLKKREHQYRYLIEGNFKIIYRRFKKGIIIVTVFDTRQNPRTLRRRAK